MDQQAMQFLGYIPYLVVGAVVMVGSIVWGYVHNTKLKIKHGYPLENMWGMPIHPKSDAEAQERIRLITQENAALRAEIASIKDRLAVVERIVTDKGFDVARQIDQLRDAEAGVPLTLDRDKKTN